MINPTNPSHDVSVDLRNADYLTDSLGFKPHYNPLMFEDTISCMRRYEEAGNPWWRIYHSNPVELCANQMDEPHLLITLEQMAKGFSTVLGRTIIVSKKSHNAKSVFTDQGNVCSIEDLKQEFKKRYPEYKEKVKLVKV